MIRWDMPFVLALVVPLCAGLRAQGNTMTFDDLPVGTLFGAAAGDSPNDFVYEQDGIRMSVDHLLVNGVQGFLTAEVGGRYASFFDSNPLDLNNISVRLDFRHLGFAVTGVSLEFIELGPLSNFAVNDDTLYQLSSMHELPFDVAPGVHAEVVGNIINLEGAIDEVLIGGQELAIDTILAIPEPATLLLLALGGVALRKRRAR